MADRVLATPGAPDNLKKIATDEKARAAKGKGNSQVAHPERDPTTSMSADLAILEKALGHSFRDRELLERALTHKSKVYEKSAEGQTAADNEQLEFLGDAILGFAVSESLVRRFAVVPGRPSFEVEGSLGQRRPSLRGSAEPATRRLSAARPRRGDERRPREEGAAFGCRRSPDRRAVSGSRPRSHPPIFGGARHRRLRSPRRRRRQCGDRPQKRPAGNGAGPEAAAPAL